MAFVRGALATRPSDSQFMPEIAVPRRKARTERRTEALAIIDTRSLERECLVRSIRLSHPGLSVEGYASVDDWSKADHDTDPVAILYSVGARQASDAAVGGEIARLVALAGSTPAIVLAESEDLREMIEALDGGAGGYIPASIGIDVVIEATRLTAAGGMFLPVASAVTRSPWLIHTSSRPVANSPVNRGSRVSVGVTQARPNSAWWPASTVPPSCAIIVCWP